MTQTETLFEMPSEYALEAPSIPVVPGPAGVCHACGRSTPQGFTNACKACQWKGCKAVTMEDE